MTWSHPILKSGVFAVGLVAVWALALSLKGHYFALSSFGPDHSFWMESAQRFRYMAEVSAGRDLPDPDVRMQAPEGYSPWSDTVFQEVLYGKLHAWFGSEIERAPFVRALSALFSSSAVFAVALLALALARRRDAALLAALVYAVVTALAERGTGTTLFREDLAFPVLCWHLAALAWWTQSGRRLAALCSGLALAVSLLLWKVLTFYFLLLVALLASAHWMRRERPDRLLFLSLALLVPSGVLALLPLSLRADSFLSSTSFLAMLAVTAVLGLERLAQGRWGTGTRLGFLSPALMVGLFAGLRFVLPRERGYNHAWETILAKIRHLGVKPDDPAELSFHARHYWTGNYESPSLQSFLEQWPWLLVAALPGLWVLLRSWKRRASDEGLAAGVPAEAGPRPGPELPALLPPMAAHFGLWMLVSFTASYLAFRKLQLFFGLALVVVLAVGFAAIRWHRPLVRIAVCIAVLLLLVQTPRFDRFACPDDSDFCASTLRGMAAAVRLAPPRPSSEWRSVDVFPSRAFDELARSLPTIVAEDEAVLASFVVSPFILAYLDRPTVLHCFFEGEILGRLEQITTARFKDEEALWRVSRRYGARWYLHEPHHLLRTDGRMSQRYVADQLDWPAESALAKMQYAPEELEHFELAWENDWFRLFRVLGPEDRAAGAGSNSAAPLWSRSLFRSLYGDPLEARSAGAEPVPPDLLYSTLWAEHSLGLAREFERREPSDSPQSAALAMQALLTAPYLWRGEEVLAGLKGAQGDPAAARLHRHRSQLLQAALRGEIPVPAPLVPRPVLLDGGP
ncbi:MAG: hypothetical protein VX498_02340 [Myxococcota bacterium]|nr:hypothetical protein [Myxococcota bacterium]